MSVIDLTVDSDSDDMTTAGAPRRFPIIVQRPTLRDYTIGHDYQHKWDPRFLTDIRHYQKDANKRVTKFKAELNTWVQLHRHEKTRNIAQNLAKRIRYISMKLFMKNMFRCINWLKRILLKTNGLTSNYHLMMHYSSENHAKVLKSSVWLSHYVKESLGNTHFCGFFNRIDGYLKTSRDGLTLDGLNVIENIILVDDASYSGTQVSEMLQDIIMFFTVNTSRRERVLKIRDAVHIWILIPYISKAAVMHIRKELHNMHFTDGYDVPLDDHAILSEILGRRNEISWVFERRQAADVRIVIHFNPFPRNSIMKNTHEIFKEVGINVGNKYEGTMEVQYSTLTLFDHKVPDTTSFFRFVLQGRLLNSLGYFRQDKPGYRFIDGNDRKPYAMTTPVITQLMTPLIENDQARDWRGKVRVSI